MKKVISMMLLTLLVGTGMFAGEKIAVLASSAQESAVHSLDEETVSELISFVTEKWDDGALKSEEGIRDAIAEGEDKFAVDIPKEAEDRIVQIGKKVGKLNLDSEKVAEKARELYDTYGDELAVKAEEFLADEAGNIGSVIKETLKEQVLEPAKTAAAETAKSMVKTFFSDVKDSVVGFVKNIFNR